MHICFLDYPIFSQICERIIFTKHLSARQSLLLSFVTHPAADYKSYHAPLFIAALCLLVPSAPVFFGFFFFKSHLHILLVITLTQSPL